jgi:hypothetical protein
MSYFEKSKRVLVSVSCMVLAPSLVALAIVSLGIQMMEFGGNQEILPLSSFLLLLSLSALGFNWCRTAPKYSSEGALQTACRSAIELFVASLLALVSAGLAFLQQRFSSTPAVLAQPIFILHMLFLGLALVLFLGAILSMLFRARGK